MKTTLPIFFSVMVLTGCNNSHSPGASENKHDTTVIVHRDTVVLIKKENTGEHRSVAEEKKGVKKDSSVKTPLPKISETKTEADTTYHYYINKSVSVKITPLINNERWVLLYNLQHEETYRQQEIRKSFSETAQLKFHQNGAVSKMEIHSNPGASMYWYETTITFSTTNDPLQKTGERKPYEEEPLKQKPWEYWDNKAKQWKKQEAQE